MEGVEGRDFQCLFGGHGGSVKPNFEMNFCFFRISLSEFNKNK